MTTARRKVTVAEPPSATVVPAWLQLVGVAVLALVALVFVGILSIIGKPIPDALVSGASLFGGAVLAMVRGRQ